jgi:hypothetical protein
MNKKILFYWFIWILILFLYHFLSIPTTREPLKNRVDLEDMPFFSDVSCNNNCGPKNICSITGEQCSRDSDCKGCDNIHKYTHRDVSKKEPDFPADNDSGKLTNQETPNYSILTTDIGTRARLFNRENKPPPQYFQGINTWRTAFNSGKKLYDKRYSTN